MPGDVSQVSICNLALARLGIARIVSFDGATSAARICEELFPSSHRWLLREHPWTFAQKYATLAQLATNPAFDYSYAYQLPSDCLYALSTDEQSTNFATPREWEIRGRTLVTNLETIQIRYVHLVEDFTLVSPEYESLLAWRLDVQMAMPLTKSLKMKADVKAEFDSEFLEAVGADSAYGTGGNVDTGSNELVIVRGRGASVL